MAWFRLDDQGAFHAKTVRAGNEAYGAWVRAGQWSSGHGTDGFIEEAIALTIAPKKIWSRLVDVRLCETREGGWAIHDFLHWNPTAEQVAQKRASRSKAGQRGGQAKAANLLANAKQSRGNRLAIASNEPEQNPSKHVAEVCPDPDPDPEDLPPKVPPPTQYRPATKRPATSGRSWGLGERIFEDGTSGMTELVKAYEIAVSTAISRPFAIPNEPSVRRTLALAANTHLRADGTIGGSLAQIPPAVSAWVAAYCDVPTMTAGWAPRKFLDWLNAGRAGPRSAIQLVGQPQKIRYLTGDER